MRLSPGSLALECDGISAQKIAAIGVKAPFPGFIEPQLATSIDKVPFSRDQVRRLPRSSPSQGCRDQSFYPARQ
jgi:hypothetical protein